MKSVMKTEDHLQGIVTPMFFLVFISLIHLCILFFLVGPCALDYTKMKTTDHYWTDPPADELVQRHRIHSGTHHVRSDSPKRPGLQVLQQVSSPLLLILHLMALVPYLLPDSFADKTARKLLTRPKILN